MLELAGHIVKTKQGHFKPETFKDRYEEALKDLLKKKAHGEKIEPIEKEEPGKVINLMDALRRSVQGSTAVQRRRSSARGHSRAAKRATRSNARHRKAG
jgi:non-homologous end joining protein Ku